jgi:hypothetical protein
VLLAPIPERQRENDHDEEAGTLVQLTNCVTNVLEPSVDSRVSLLTRRATLP